MKQFHDVDEWAFNALVTLDLPDGVARLAKQGMTPVELRDLLNASPISVPSYTASDAPLASAGSEVPASGSVVATEAQIEFTNNINTSNQVRKALR